MYVCGEKPTIYSGYVVVNTKTVRAFHSNETAFERVRCEIRVLQKRSVKTLTLTLVGVPTRLRLFGFYEHDIHMYINTLAQVAGRLILNTANALKMVFSTTAQQMILLGRIKTLLRASAEPLAL